MSDTEPTIVASKLHLLDLSAVKARMGDRWEKTSALVDRVFEATIRRNLGIGDSFVRQGELSYVLLLRDLSPLEAQVKCRTICEALGGKLFGEEVPDASLRTLVAPWTGAPQLGDDSVEPMNALLEAEGTETIVQAGQRQTVPTPAAPRKDADEEEGDYHLLMKFHHRPIWDTAVNVVINYLCQNTGTVEFPENDAATNWAEGRQAAIDRAILQESTTSIQAVHKRGFRLVSGVSVALDTISYSRLWRQYARDLQKVPPGVSRDFVFFVNKIDNGVPNIRLTAELPKLTKYARGIFCVLSDQGYVGTRFSRTGTHAIGIDLAPRTAEAVAMARISELAKQAASAKLAAFVLGISSRSVMLHAMSQGIRYLEGPVIRAAVPEPRYAFAQSLEDVYASP